jgi:hypothetical protein
MNPSTATTIYYEYLYEISAEHEPTKLMYGWSKWGGASKGMVQGLNNVWYCQSCRKESPISEASFMFPIFDREFGRICRECLDVAILKKMKSLWELMKLHERGKGLFD